MIKNTNKNPFTRFFEVIDRNLGKDKPKSTSLAIIYYTTFLTISIFLLPFYIFKFAAKPFKGLVNLDFDAVNAFNKEEVNNQLYDNSPENSLAHNFYNAKSDPQINRY